MPEPLAAIILAGGASRRMGRDKAGIRPDGGPTLLERTIAGVVRAGATEVVVAGDAPGATGPGATGPGVPPAVEVTFVREDPPLSGPVPALDAALERVTAGLVLVLPCDLAEPATAADHLVRSAAALAPGTGTGTDTGTGTGADTAAGSDSGTGTDVAGSRGRDGLVAVDAEGHRQHLTALFRTDALRAGSTAGSPASDGRVRSRVAGLDLLEVTEPSGHPGLWTDLDTPEDLERYLYRRAGRVTDRPPAPDPEAAPAAPRDPDIPGLELWLRAAAGALGLPESAVVTGPLLAAARDVARGVIRPGAPTTTYLIGLAVGRALGRGASPEEADRLVAQFSARIQDLTVDYDPDESPDEGDRP